ncbi:MAG: hypothetical protein FGM24_10045, partial [Candidatus Kapabacteria bacterium]|nr:hypothetical protein [Candidatus Kapabacteria bacterium]
MSLDARYAKLTSRLRATGRREQLMAAAGGLLLSAAVACTTITIFVFVESFINGSMQVRSMLWWTWWGSTVVALALLAGPALLRLAGIMHSDDVDALARRVGTAYD